MKGPYEPINSNVVLFTCEKIIFIFFIIISSVDHKKCLDYAHSPGTENVVGVNIMPVTGTYIYIYFFKTAFNFLVNKLSNMSAKYVNFAHRFTWLFHREERICVVMLSLRQQNGQIV